MMRAWVSALLAALAVSTAGTALAEAPASSIRPLPRGELASADVEVVMARARQLAGLVGALEPWPEGRVSAIGHAGDGNIHFGLQAPDGWIRADEVRTLSGRAPRLPIPDWVAQEIVRFNWEKGIVATPPGIMPYATNPWVVSNDRLKKLGWEPACSNDEAYVDGYDPRPWAMLNAKRRQQLALGGSAIELAGLATAIRFISRRVRN